MDDTADRAELARLRLACYLRLARVAGEARVVPSRLGPRIAVVLARLTVDAVAAVPPSVDGVPVEVRV